MVGGPYATLTSQLHAYFETGQVADAYTNNLFYIGFHRESRRKLW